MEKFLVVLVLLFIVGCASYQPSTEYNFVKVLGVTVEGDTILIDINSLRPKIYNNYYYRNDYNRYPYNYNYWNNPPVIIRPPNKPNRPVITLPTNNPPISKPIPKPIKDSH
jgi:hypothetical protein